MKSKEELNKEAQHYINQYKTDIVYGTSDGQFFLDKNRRDLHAKSKKGITVYDFPKDGTLNENPKEEINKQLRETEDLSTIPYPSLVKWVKELELETENAKTPTLIEALTQYKETLK